jgi:uncharacterized protein (TIGR02246 family)
MPVEVSQARLQRLIDEDDIRSVLIRFGRALDERRWDDYAALYAEDAVLQLPHGRHEGREGLAEFVGADLGRYVATQHISASHDITVAGDTAEARSSLIGVHVTSEDHQSFWMGGGWYHTRLRREPDGTWLLTKVEARPDWLSIQGDAVPPSPA